MADELEEIIKPLCPLKDQEDKWWWTETQNHVYTVKSAYDKLLNNSETETANEIERNLLRKYWRTACPSKYLIHGWRVLIDRLPTRQQLQRRGVTAVQQNVNCAFCSLEVEESTHLFFNCSLSVQLWNEVFNWLELKLVVCSNAWEHLAANRSTQGGKMNKKIQFMAWVSITWVIWLKRNRKIFKGEVPNVSHMSNHVKGLLWGWMSCGLGGSPIEVEDWNSNPSLCLNRL